MDEGRDPGTGQIDFDDALLRRFFDMSVDLLAILDLDTTVLQASGSWDRTLGWSQAELIGRPLMDLVHEDDLASVAAGLASVHSGDGAVAVMARLRTADGTYRWLQGNARPDLAVGRIYVTGTDITDRVELEEALRRQLDLEELVASVAARLIGTEHDHVTDEIERGIAELAQALGADRGHFLRGRRRPEDTTYVEWRNPATVEREHSPAADPVVQRWWRDALRSQRLLRLDDIEDLADEAPHVVNALRDDGVRSLLHVPLPPHRGHWGFLTMVAVRGQVSFSDDATALLRLGGECFMTALAERDDAIALRDVRDELERRNEALERTNEELEHFAYAAAHDLKAPLARIEMALSASPSAGASADELLGVARRATTRMRQLIEDLLAFAAAGSPVGSAELVDLDDLLTQVLGDLAPDIAQRGVRVERSPLPAVRGHGSLLGQLLQNLVGNAVKFARPGADALVQVDAAEPDDGVTIAVRDNGIGIPPDDRGEVFAVFTRLHPEGSYTGSGIGLATCAKVVRHHEGRIWIEDGIDGGIAVCFWLPNTSSEPSS